MTEMKHSILSQVLDQQARARRRGLCACLSKTLYKSSVKFVSQVTVGNAPNEFNNKNNILHLKLVRKLAFKGRELKLSALPNIYMPCAVRNISQIILYL